MQTITEKLKAELKAFNLVEETKLKLEYEQFYIDTAFDFLARPIYRNTNANKPAIHIEFIQGVVTKCLVQQLQEAEEKLAKYDAITKIINS